MSDHGLLLRIHKSSLRKASSGIPHCHLLIETSYRYLPTYHKVSKWQVQFPTLHDSGGYCWEKASDNGWISWEKPKQILLLACHQLSPRMTTASQMFPSEVSLE